jgi:hypothetical protein
LLPSPSHHPPHPSQLHLLQNLHHSTPPISTFDYTSFTNTSFNYTTFTTLAAFAITVTTSTNFYLTGLFL